MSWETLVAIGAVVAAGWQRVRALLGWLRGLLLVTARMDSDDAEMLIGYLAATARSSRSGDRCSLSFRAHVAALHGQHVVWAQGLQKSASTFWLRRVPIWYRNGTDRDHMDLGAYCQRFTYLRGTVDFEALLVAAAAWATEHAAGGDRSRFKVVHHHGMRLDPAMFDRERNHESPAAIAGRRTAPSQAEGHRLIGFSWDELSGSSAPGLENMALSEDLHAIAAEIRGWHKLREWCAAHGVPWRRSYAFAGPPGTGKSSFVRAIAEELGIPVHVFDLASMGNADLRTAWAQMLADAPCVALVEDVDGVFHGRDNVAPSQGAIGGGGLTFDALLQCLQGVDRADGVLSVLTTNHLEHLDPALAADTGDPDMPSRPGRADRIVRFEPLGHAGKVQIALRILDGDRVTAERLAGLGAADTAAQFQERCFRLALARQFGEAA